jgi:hypothetical protein
VLLAATERGGITGFGGGEAQRRDPPLAETFFAARALPHPALAGVGRWYGGYDVVDTGCEGRANRARGEGDYEPTARARTAGRARCAAGWRGCARSPRRPSRG